MKMSERLAEEMKQNADDTLLYARAGEAGHVTRLNDEHVLLRKRQRMAQAMEKCIEAGTDGAEGDTLTEMLCEMVDRILKLEEQVTALQDANHKAGTGA